jgi:hypothetical protein
MKIATKKSRGAVLGAALLCMATGNAIAAGGPFEFDYCFASQLQSMKHSDTHTVNLSNGQGTFKTTPSGQMFDNHSAQCMSVFTVIEGRVDVNGYCEWLSLDGDRLLISFERSGNADGKFRSISGTGKYQTMKVDGTYTAGKFPQRPGTSVNCAHIKGMWEQP